MIVLTLPSNCADNVSVFIEFPETVQVCVSKTAVRSMQRSLILQIEKKQQMDCCGCLGNVWTAGECDVGNV